jgi:hypothetical protein
MVKQGEFALVVFPAELLANTKQKRAVPARSKGRMVRASRVQLQISSAEQGRYEN